jgi:hypothetical protein
VHARVAPTRQAVVMMHVVVWASNDHGEKLSGTGLKVNGAARRMQRAGFSEGSKVAS